MRPPTPVGRFSIGVTGHRAAHASFAGREEPVEAALRDVFAVIDDGVQSARGPVGPTRLHTLLADGTDLMAAELALARGWDLVAPLPFGRALNCAINAQPKTPADAILAGTLPAAA